LGDLEARDVAAAVAWAKPAGLPIVVVGASMGAVAALRFAASGGSDLAGVVAVSAPATWRVRRSLHGVLLYVLTRTSFGRGYVRRRVGVRVDPRWSDPPAPVELVRRISVPVAVVHGRRDHYIASGDAEIIYQAAASPRKRLYQVRGMGHAYHEKAVPVVVEAVGWILGAEG
jgi:pimeloyl-ACP methyl ester carboxylesterase